MNPLLLRTLAIFLGSSLASHAADWPEFLGPNRDGTSPETGLLERFPEGGPRVVWQKDTGIGYATPSVRDGAIEKLTPSTARAMPEAVMKLTLRSLTSSTAVMERLPCVDASF